MTKQRWEDVVPATDKYVYKVAGFGDAVGFGKKPAVLVIDVQYKFCGERSAPIREMIKEYPLSCGEAAWQAIPKIAELLDLTRSKGFPVFYAQAERKGAAEAGPCGTKNPGLLASGLLGSRGAEIVNEVAPRPGDYIVSKRRRSVFHGTPLLDYLISLSIDTIIITGCTTSGCVRAAVTDSYMYSFRTIVPEECVFDRSELVHDFTLWDLKQKTADVLPLAEVKAELSRISA